MSSNDFERKLEFLVRQQVQSAAETQALRESLLGLATRTDSLAASVEGLTTRTDSLAASVERLGRKVDVLVEVQADQHTRLVRVEDSFVLLVQMAKLTDERLNAFENRFSEFDARFSDIGARLITLSEHTATLAAVQSHSDERLNTLIDVVERYIRHNGGNANE